MSTATALLHDDTRQLRPQPPTPKASAATVVDLLAEGARRGDRRAMGRIIERERSRVRAILIRRLGFRHDLDDLEQTVFLELCVALQRYRGDGTLSAFVAGIACMVAKRARRPCAFESRRMPLDEDSVATDNNPEEAAVVRAQLAGLQTALSKLRPAQREALLAWVVDGKSPKEIAAATGASVSAVRSRIFYGQKNLKEKARFVPSLNELRCVAGVG